MPQCSPDIYATHDALWLPIEKQIDTLTRDLRIYDKMVNDDRDGTRPLYRPKEWNIVARRKEKERKKYD